VLVLDGNGSALELMEWMGCTNGTLVLWYTKRNALFLVTVRIQHFFYKRTPQGQVSINQTETATSPSSIQSTRFKSRKVKGEGRRLQLAFGGKVTTTETVCGKGQVRLTLQKLSRRKATPSSSWHIRLRSSPSDVRVILHVTISIISTI
jgi:hypothetical protein